MSRTLAPAIRLGPGDFPEGRRFAHPDHVAADQAVLCMLTRDLSRHLAAEVTSGPIISYVPHPDAWHRRVVIPHPDAFRHHATITVVGFFGRVRDVVDPVVADRIKTLSDRLVDAVLTSPGVLGYTTHLLADEKNYANLVLVSTPETIEQWRTTPPHPTAAGDWSPRYYQHVRIYRGSVPGASLDCDGAVQLESVKYWDYRDDPTWYAVRSLA